MLYQHIDPELVGNDMRMLVSDMAGRASVEIKGKQLGYDLSGDKATVGRVVNRVKRTGGPRLHPSKRPDASFELLLRDELAGERQRHFQVESWRVITWSVRSRGGPVVSEATVKLHMPSGVSGSWPPGRATGRSTRWTRRCGSAWSGSTRSWPCWNWRTTRSASLEGLACGPAR